MPSKEDNIIKNYLKKVIKIEKHNKSYYDKDAPKITDHEYDVLKKEVLELEKNYLFLKNYSSVNSQVGFKPSSKFNKIKLANSTLIHSNALYIGNNQFVNTDRMNKLEKLMKIFFS